MKCRNLNIAHGSSNCSHLTEVDYGASCSYNCSAGYYMEDKSRSTASCFPKGVLKEDLKTKPVCKSITSCFFCCLEEGFLFLYSEISCNLPDITGGEFKCNKRILYDKESCDFECIPYLKSHYKAVSCMATDKHPSGDLGQLPKCYGDLYFRNDM